MKLSTLAFSLAAAGAITAVLSGCGGGAGGGDASPATATQAARSYSGAGTDWRWTFNADGTFTASESTTNSTIAGTYSTVSTGLQKLTVTSSTGQGPAPGAVIPAVEVPGFATLFAPVLASETEVIGAIAAGKCPTANFTDNYLYMQFNDSIDLSATNRDFFGVFAWDATAGSGSSTSQFKMDYAPVSFPSVITGSCSSGLLSTTNFNAYLAPAAAFVKITDRTTPTFGDGLIAMPAAPITNLANLYGNYSGFLYDATASQKVRLLTATINAATFTVTSVSSSDLVTPDGAVSTTVNFAGVDQPAPGFIQGNVQGQNLICMAGANVTNSGKNALFCLVRNPSNNTKPLSVVLVSHS